MKPASTRQLSVLLKAGYAQAELAGLTSRQASDLLYYVSRNEWKRPSQAQIDAIASAELTEDDSALQLANFVVKIPTFDEFQQLIDELSPAKGVLLEDAFGLLKHAAEQGSEAALDQGRALCILQANCPPQLWEKMLATFGLPSLTATRQIAAAKAELAKDAKARKALESDGVRFL